MAGTWDLEANGIYQESGSFDDDDYDAALAAGITVALTYGTTDWHVVVRDSSGVSKRSQRGADYVPITPPTQGEGGETSGGGSTGGDTGGTGDERVLAYRARLVGVKWQWTNQNLENPMYWEGSSSEYDITSSAYDYGSAEDALEAGKAAASTKPNVVRVVAEPNIEGFPSLQHTYADRYAEATNAASKEKADAVAKFIATHHWDGTAWVLDTPVVPNTPYLPDTQPPAAQETSAGAEVAVALFVLGGFLCVAAGILHYYQRGAAQVVEKVKVVIHA